MRLPLASFFCPLCARLELAAGPRSQRLGKLVGALARVPLSNPGLGPLHKTYPPKEITIYSLS